MEESTTEQIAEVLLDSPSLMESKPVNLLEDIKTGLKHIVSPAILGALFGSGWQRYGLPKLDSLFATYPVQFELLFALLLQPLFYRILVHTSFARCLEYSFGFSALALPLCVVWLSGWGALFCGMYAILLAWVSISMMWSRKQLPPFSYGIWHAMGVDLGAFAGAVVMYNALGL